MVGADTNLLHMHARERHIIKYTTALLTLGIIINSHTANFLEGELNKSTSAYKMGVGILD